MDDSFISLIKTRLEETSDLLNAILMDQELLAQSSSAAQSCIKTLNRGGTIYFCGNGGSFSDAQHLAAELTGRFYINRRPFRAEALASNPAHLTAVANDFGYEHIFSRQLEAFAQPGDTVFCLSTSGRSPSILAALKKAKELKANTILMTGQTPPPQALEWTDIVLSIPSKDVPRIQEGHKLIGHSICELIEKELK